MCLLELRSSEGRPARADGRRVCRVAAAVAGLVAAAGLQACARYERRPLDKSAYLAVSTSDLAGSGGKAVSLATLDRLVLANNPDLRAARAQRGVAQAQVVAADVLPNPQVTAAYPFLVSGPGTVDSYSAGFVQDVKSMLLRPTRLEVARAGAASIDATLAWQEWQTIGKARLLFVDIVSGERTLGFIAQSRKLLKERYDLTSKAIAQGNATLATLSPDLVAVGDIARAQDDLARLQLSRRHQLAALLGLSPDAPLALEKSVRVPQIEAGAIRRQLATIADRRPDLVALQLGYRSDDAKVREAILTQFPNLAIGPFAGQDTSNILAIGPQLTMDLPVFDRNQGGIALETATRERLHREFTARITTATSEIGSLLTEQALARRQLAELEPRLHEARTIATRVQDAFKQGTFDERAYVDIETARLAREQEKVALEQVLLDGQVALATLVGAGFPAVTIPPEAPPANPLGLLGEAIR